MPRSNLPALPATMSLPITASIIPQHFVHPGLSLSQIMAILWAHRKATLYIAAAITVFVACVVWVMPKTFSATATLMVDYEVNDPLGGKEFPIGLLGTYMSTQIELMRSDEVLMPVVDQLKLTDNKNYTKGFSDEPGRLRQWVAKAISKKLLIEQGQYGSQLIYISFSANNPADAALIANTVAEIYMQQQYQRLTGPASERSKRYLAQLEELKQSVSRAQDQVTGFRQRTGLIDVDAKSDTDMERLSSLQQQLVEAQSVRRNAEARASQNQSVGQQVLSSSLIQTLKAQLALETANLAQLKATLGSAHPQIIELRSQIEATRASLAAEVGSYSSGASSDLNSTRQMESELQQAVDDQRAKVLNVQKIRDEGARYQLDLQSAQSVYKQALDGYDQFVVASSGHYTNTSFVSRADPPLRASKPKVLVDLLAGALAGMMLGLLGPLGYDLLNRRVRCRDDVERDHNVPVLVEFGISPMQRTTS